MVYLKPQQVKWVKEKQLTCPDGRRPTCVEKKCVPIAPYKCPPMKEVNDFDIRTHRDFYKFVKSDRIRPPTPMVDQRSINDFDIKSHRDYPQYMKKGDFDLVSEVSKESNPTKLKKIIQNLASKGIDFGEMISSSSDQGAIKRVATSLLANPEIPVSDIISNLPPAATVNLVQKISKSDNLSDSELLKLFKNPAHFKQVIESGLSTQKISPKQIIDSIQNTRELKNMINSQCRVVSKEILLLMAHLVQEVVLLVLLLICQEELVLLQVHQALISQVCHLMN